MLSPFTFEHDFVYFAEEIASCLSVRILGYFFFNVLGNYLIIYGHFPINVEFNHSAACNCF